MATVQHSTLTSAELHEPKGVATANANTVYIADGAGSGQWRLKPNGYAFYDNDTGTTFTTPTSPTLCNVTTNTSGTIREFTSNGAGRLTYTGAATIGVAIRATLNYIQGAGSATNIVLQLYVNGVAAGPKTRVRTGTTLVDRADVVSFQTTFATNDYAELYITSSVDDVTVKALSIDVEGIV